MASHHLIEAHLAELRRRLPADVVDELADGLTETYEHHLASGHPPSSAADSCHSPSSVTPSDHRTPSPARHPAAEPPSPCSPPGRPSARCWGSGSCSDTPGPGRFPIPLRVAFGLTLLAAIAALLTAAASRLSYARTRIAAAGALALITLDLALITAVLLVAPRLTWPMAAAIPASLTRLTLTARAVPGILTR